MLKTFNRLMLASFFSLATQLASADVSGAWTFSVTLDIGSGNAAITLMQEAEGKLTGTYSGQLANGPVEGTHDGNNFEFSFVSDALGGTITYRGELKEDGTVSGSVVVAGESIGSFTGRKSG
ncbi:MAG: hypothetical protein IIC60_13020 [Proteobacteria bacterium]|nr:hypothetical protein [Pseudomonadota bacterium]